MFAGLEEFFSTTSFMPHGHCYLWKPPLVVLHAVSDALIGTAYVVISLTLWELVRRIRLPFSPMILAFGVFIGACGLTHYMEIWTLWDPEYWISGGVKAVTAAASVATGAYLVRLRPGIVSVARSAQLSEERRVALEVKNRELEALYSRVKELDDAKTRFFANASHELRTPLALVLGPVEKLLSDELASPVRAELVVVQRNARRLLRHVNDLLDVARLDEGRLTVERRRTDLSALLRDVASQFDALARERHIALEVLAPATLPAELDGPKIDRVLANLIGNAFKFAPDGGRVSARLAEAAGEATITVEDDGPGIAPEMREAVFERFRQDPGRPSASGGAGLGLAIAREFVEAHGGRIHVEDAPARGARLVLSLPVAGGPRTGARPPAPAPERASVARELVSELRASRVPDRAPVEAGRPDAPTVLAVEDHPDALRALAGALAAEFHVVTASGGAEALQKAEALRPDAIVTDLMMPGMPGDVLLAEVQRRPVLADTPALVLTARADEDARVRLLEAGASDYVVKPYRAEELRVRVRNLVASKRSRDVLARELDTRTGALDVLVAELARRKREVELAADTARVAREQAERASHVKTTFLGLVSHELRTPLTALQLGLAGLRGGPLTERQTTSVGRLARATTRLLALVESLLEYTRVESGRVVVTRESVDLTALAAEVVEDVLPHAQQKLLTLALDPPTPVPPLHSDPRLVRLVLMNLVMNGVKYTERGEVRVAVGHGARGHFLVVRDTGEGMSPEDQLRALKPFEQLDPARSAGGVGLGLSLVRGVVEALGGRLTMESAVGAGTTARVDLPAAPEHASAEVGGRADPASGR
jgi:signal transduction histidine kinase